MRTRMVRKLRDTEEVGLKATSPTSPVNLAGDQISSSTFGGPDNLLDQVAVAVFLPLHEDHVVANLQPMGFGAGIEFEMTVESEKVH